MNKSKLIEITWLILSVLVYALIITDELYFNEGKYLYIISLLISSVYCLQFICLVFFRPIKRDWILTKGHFLFKVVNFVSLIPIVLISLTTINNKFCTTKISAKDFIFEDNLYSDKYYKQDTVRGYISYNRTDTLCINDTIIPISTTGSDNIYIPVKSKLPDEIYKGQKDPTLLWTILYHYIDPGNQHMTSSKYGRWAALFIAVLVFFLLNGLLISTLINWFDRRREHWLNGNIRYNRCSFWFENVAFVIGANEAAGIDGTPCLSQDGYAKLVAQYDKHGNMTEESYYGIDGTPCLCPNGYAKAVAQYDKRGNMTDALFYDENGNDITEQFIN